MEDDRAGAALTWVMVRHVALSREQWLVVVRGHVHQQLVQRAGEVAHAEQVSALARGAGVQHVRQHQQERAAAERARERGEDGAADGRQTAARQQ